MKGLKEEEEGAEEEEEEVEEEEEEEPCRHILFFLRRRLREPGVCAVGRLGEMISWGSLWPLCGGNVSWRRPSTDWRVLFSVSTVKKRS